MPPTNRGWCHPPTVASYRGWCHPLSAQLVLRSWCHPPSSPRSWRSCSSCHPPLMADPSWRIPVGATHLLRGSGASVFLANGHIHRSLGQRPRFSTANGLFWPKAMLKRSPQHRSRKNVDYGRWPNEHLRGTSTRGVAPGYDEDGRWPKCRMQMMRFAPTHLVPPTTNQQPTTNNEQRTTNNHQPPTTNHQPLSPITNRQSEIANHKSLPPQTSPLTLPRKRWPKNLQTFREISNSDPTEHAP